MAERIGSLATLVQSTKDAQAKDVAELFAASRKETGNRIAENKEMVAALKDKFETLQTSIDNLNKGNERIAARLTALPDLDQLVKQTSQLHADQMLLLKKVAAAQENLAGKSDVSDGLRSRPQITCYFVGGMESSVRAGCFASDRCYQAALRAAFGADERAPDQGVRRGGGQGVWARGHPGCRQGHGTGGQHR